LHNELICTYESFYVIINYYLIPYSYISLYLISYIVLELFCNAFFLRENIYICIYVQTRTNYSFSLSLFSSYFRNYSSHVPRCLREWRSCAENASSVSLLSSYEWNIGRIIANIFPPEKRAPCLRPKLWPTITHFLKNP